MVVELANHYLLHTLLKILGYHYSDGFGVQIFFIFLQYILLSWLEKLSIFCQDDPHDFYYLLANREYQLLDILGYVLRWKWHIIVTILNCNFNIDMFQVLLKLV